VGSTTAAAPEIRSLRVRFSDFPDVAHPLRDDRPGMTLGTEVRLLDDVAACLRAMAACAVAYDDETLFWLADQVERAADRSQELADAQAAVKLLSSSRVRDEAARRASAG
jgi:hypothetical protein